MPLDEPIHQRLHVKLIAVVWIPRKLYIQCKWLPLRVHGGILYGLCEMLVDTKKQCMGGQLR